jgi:PEP-CTERM motif
MRSRTLACGLLCVACLCLSRQVQGGSVTPVQTQSTSASGGLTATNWGAGTAGINNPLVFNQFDPKLGTLTGVDITLTTNIRNDFMLVFVPTPIVTTIDVATTQTTDPSVLNDPAKRALLTDGPTVTLFAPNGASIFGPPATRQPVDFVQLTESSGTWSSLLPFTDPHFIPPSVTEQSFSRSLTSDNAPSLFSDFIGTGSVGLPVTATSFSSFFSSSGNGGGAVLTKANATVMIQYEFTPHSVPEPTSLLLLGVGIAGILVTRRLASGHRKTQFASSKASSAKGHDAVLG